MTLSCVMIIDHGSGNLRSVSKALSRVAEKTGHKVRITARAEDLSAATHLILPGVGAFADCMAGLRSLPGMISALEHQVVEKGMPLLGICVGMQMLFERGYEYGSHPGLGWLKGEIVPIPNNGLKIPHMGWNELTLRQNHPLLGDIADSHAYFVHSYYADCSAEVVLASTDYGQKLPAIVGRGNLLGTQFHPEKSQAPGLKLLENFLLLH